jgi:hypothetical protein
VKIIYTTQRDVTDRSLAVRTDDYLRVSRPRLEAVVVTAEE